MPLTKLFDYAFKTCGAALRYPPGWRSPLQPMPKLEWRDHGGSNSDP